MTIGPLQLVWVKFADEQRTGDIVQELKAVRKTGVIRLVDMLYVFKDLNGALQLKEVSDLAEAQKAEYGLILQGLLGMRAAHKTAGEVDKIAAAMSLSPGDFGLSSQQVQQMAQDLPNGGSAIMILFEHVWAVRLKEALFNAGGQLIAQGLLSPETLALGGTTLEEAMAAAKKIEEQAEIAAAAETTAVGQKLAEAQRLLDETEVQTAARMEQAKTVAAATIAASVRMAAKELTQADEYRKQSEKEAAETAVLGAEIAYERIQTGEQIEQQEIEEGLQIAEEIKSAAVVEAFKLLVEAQLIKKEVARQAIAKLTEASLIRQAAADDLLFLER